MQITKELSKKCRGYVRCGLLLALAFVCNHGAAQTTIPLTVSFYYPTNGQTYTAPANIVVHALVLDSAVVRTVQYFANGTNIGTRTNTGNIPFTNSTMQNPFAQYWTNVGAGSYQLTAVATDTNGIVVTSAPVNISVLGSPPPPPIPLSVSFYYPTNGQTYTGPANITFRPLVLDSNVVQTVQYIVNGISIGTRTNTNNILLTNTSTPNPFGFVWSSVGAGTYSLTAIATDSSGTVVTSAPVHITVLHGVSPIPLTVSFLYPTNGQTFTAPANIGVHALVLDSNVVETVEYFANGTSIGIRTNTGNILLTNVTAANPFALYWTSVAAGNYALTAVATDSSGTMVTSAPVSISVVPPTPPPPTPFTVGFYYPTNGETFTAPADIAVHASVTDSNVVQTIAYYANGTNIGTVSNVNNILLTNTTTGNPFLLLWSNVAAGTYSLTAVATDASASSVTSAPVSITVVTPAPPPPIPLTVSFYYPTNGETYTAPANIGLHALVLDSTLVKTVQYFANGTNLGTRSNILNVVLTNTTIANPFFLDWSNVPAGTYSLTAVVTDAADAIVTSAPVNITVHSPTVSPTNKAVLTLLVNGSGRITGQANGASLVVNKTYSVGAVPSVNWLFSNWMIGTNSSSLTQLTNGPSLAFVMISNLIIQANFETNPFIAVAGTYNGLFYPATGVTEESSGFITVTIPVSTHGYYSAKLLLDGGSYPFTGAFDLTGFSEKIVNRPGKTPVTVDLNISLAGAADQITGTVTDNEANGWSSALHADRTFFNSQTTPASAYAGKYTLLVPPGPEAPTNEPGGFGYATLSVSLAGRACLAGQLADGATLSQTVPISRQGRIPIYVSLYSGHGSFLGWLLASDTILMNPPQSIAGTNMAWFRPPLTTSTSLYAGGFAKTNIAVDGSPYLTPPSGGNVLDLTNGTLTISNADTGGDLVFSNLRVAGSKLVNSNTNGNPTNHLVGYFIPGTGVMTLSFRPTGAHADTVARGVALQQAAPVDGGGWFIDTNRESESFLLSQ